MRSAPRAYGRSGTEADGDSDGRYHHLDCEFARLWSWASVRATLVALASPCLRYYRIISKGEINYASNPYVLVRIRYKSS